MPVGFPYDFLPPPPTPNYYVSNAGSDSNAGTSKAAPFLTIGKALTVIGATANQTIGLGKGSVFRESGLTIGSNSLAIVAYGNGVDPQILGSNVVSTAWTLTGGTEYQTALAYTPRTAFWLSVAGIVTKLRPGTSGALTLYQYAVAGGNLHVNIGFDPTGQRIEIAANNSNTGIAVATNSGFHMTGIAVMFMPFTGFQADATPDVILRDCTISFNGDDGVSIINAGCNVSLYHTTVQGNGYQFKNGGGGPGDGISAHNGAVMLVDSCTVIDNDQTGLGNESNTFVTARYNYVRNNYNNVFIYNSGIVAAGTHNFYYNIFVNTPTDSAPFSVNGPLNVGALMFVTISNNSIWDEGSAAFVVFSTVAGTCTLKNNIISGAVYGIGDYNVAVGSDGTTIVDFNLYTNDSGNYQPGFGPATIGGNEASSATPGYTSTVAGAENFYLLTGSAAKANGVSLGYTRDFANNPVPFGAAPCRGALEREAA